LRDRALTLKRYPDGWRGFFFESAAPPPPDLAPTAELRQGDGEGRTVCLVNDLETLIWVANLATLELHVPWPGRFPGDARRRGLRPGPRRGADVLDCARVALILRDLFSRLRLEGAVKTSGQKGSTCTSPERPA